MTGDILDPEERDRALALFVADTLSYTTAPTNVQLAELSAALREYCITEDHQEAEGRLIQRVIDVGFSITPSFSPDEFQAFMESLDSGILPNQDNNEQEEDNGNTH